MNLLSSLLAYTARQIGLLKSRADSSSTEIDTTKSRVTTLESKVDNFTTNIKPDAVETLWTGSKGKYGDTITLSKAVSNYDFIDVYYGTYNTRCIRIPSSKTSAVLTAENLPDSSGLNFVQHYETSISISGTTITVTQTSFASITGTSALEATYSFNDTENYDDILRIDGVKIGSSTPAELIDIRTGANGVIYASAGEAIRSQFADFNSSVDDITEPTKNLLDKSTLRIGKAWNLANNANRAIMVAPVEPNTRYTLSFLEPSPFDLIYLVAKETYDGSAIGSSDITSSPFAITTASNAHYIFLQFNKNNITKADFADFWIQLEEGTEATAYENAKTSVDAYARYVAINTYDCVADMQNDTKLAVGSRAQTLGFYTEGDGGRATYVIRELGSDTADGATLISLDNGYAAELLVDNCTVNIKQLGAIPQDSARHDIAPYLSIFESKLRNKGKLYIPMGIWNCSGYLFTYPVHITGDHVFTRKNNGGMIATIITFMSNGQEYIFKLSDSTSRILPDCVIENITFSNSVYTINGNNYGVTGAYGAITDALLVADGLEFSTFNNLSFMFFNCTAMDLLGCCELFFHNTNIRGKDGVDPCIVIQKDSLRVVSSSIKFDFTQVEAILGNIFCLKNYVTNCDFGSIMFEPNQPNADYIRIPCNNAAYDDTHMIRQAVFNLDNTYVQGCHVGNLCMDGFSAYGIKTNESATYAYIYDCIFNGSSSQPLFVTFDAIDLSNAIKDFYLFNNSNGNIGGSVSFVSFGDINVSSNSGANEIIKPILNCQYVPKFSYRSRENTAKSDMIFAYDLFKNTIDASNTSVAIVGNSNMVNLDGCIANPKCAIRGFTPGNNRTDIPNIRIPYCKLYTKMHVHYSATADKESKLNFTNESNVSVSWISEQALGQWNWAEIDISNLNIAEGYQDMNYEVAANSSGFIDCILLT